MLTVVLVIHLLLAIALVGVVLLQRSEGGGLGMGGSSSGGGMGGFMTGRGTANLLTRTTAILAGLFMVTSIALAILNNMGRAKPSVLDAPMEQSQPAVPAAPAAPLAK